MNQRLERWKKEFPLRPFPLTKTEVEQGMQCRSNWALEHPLFNDIGAWRPEEQQYFDEVGKLIEDSHNWHQETKSF